jgi:surfeit locus 1 family protein
VAMITRTLFSGKWLVLSTLAVVGIAACMLAAMWQWDRSQQQLLAEQAGLAAPTPIGEVVSSADARVPIEALGRQVTVVGEYLPNSQTLVRSRLSQDGEAGFWVVNAVQTTDGAIVAALRGWSKDQEVAVATGPVGFAGRLQPDENFYPKAPIAADAPLVTITEAGLQTQWQESLGQAGGAGQMLPGFVAVTSIEPSNLGVSEVRPLIGSDPAVGFPWRNVLYSLQWLVFAGFVVVMWIRWFREDLAQARRAETEPGWQSSQPDRVSLDS